jgi:L-malate glycosyltransferase
VKVLSVNHTGAVSGGERSLLDLLDGLRETEEVRLACPNEGVLREKAHALGVPVDSIVGTDGSLKLHPRETTKAISRLSVAAAQTAVHARRNHVEAIHANSIRAGLSSVVASKLSGIPTVVHLRDRLPRSVVADATVRFLARGARMLVANSKYTADGVRAVVDAANLEVVYNPVDLRRFDRSRVDGQAVRSRLGFPQDTFLLAVVGQITPWKGQLEAIKAVGMLRRENRAVHLLIVGEAKFVSSATRYDNVSYVSDLEVTIKDEGLADAVSMLGERDDIPEIMSALDALLVPSWEEPFGRVVVEAMALGKPVLATRVGGPAEIITDGVDGVLLQPRDVPAWAHAVAQVADSTALRARLESASVKRAEDFALPVHIAAMRGLFAAASLR